ncbi:MAG: ABC transporter ATP-binding protein [Salinivirgaceae bacterium]|nr:ABC transporter ATP-binding protein [Salinivirgaceae bacterium]
MSDIAIKVENLSKKYIIGSGTSGSLRETLSNTWHNTFGGKRSDEEVFWALQDLNFEIKQGEAVGIIGHNGAGKSTLLKLLSKITYPTTGKITMNGRVSSLLEVGTGFHPELTGRENIYLNGTILGMTRREVKSKFDEIVDFSGVEKFLDTPVKRYSSGMYVRLAFAVAAHLEPEILIIDEVLAVGDAEFQKKCLGKMGEVAKGGRTVLFVSHNMNAIKSLCNKGLLLKNGGLDYSGNIEKSITKYLNSYEIGSPDKELSFPINPELQMQLTSVRLSGAKSQPLEVIDVFGEAFIEFEYLVRSADSTTVINLDLEYMGSIILRSFDCDVQEHLYQHRPVGTYKGRVKLPSPLKAGNYNVFISIIKLKKDYIDKPKRLSFIVEELSFNSDSKSYAKWRDGIIPGILEWSQSQI